MVDSTGKKKPKPKPKTTAKKPAAPGKRRSAARPKSKPKTKAAPKTTRKPAAKKGTPQQKLGDTPVMPWEMPTPQEKQQAQPVKRALKKAVAAVDSQKKADKIVENLEKSAEGKTAVDVQKSRPQRETKAAAQRIEKKADAAPKSKKTEKVLEATGRALTTEDKRQREVVSEAVQEVLNPEQQGAAPTAKTEQQREFLREAVMKRQKPLDALDANLFLKINHLPHTRPLNMLFYGLTFVYTGGAAWYALMSLWALRDRRRFGPLLWNVALPLMAAGLTVEHPIKKYFKRRRPFISIIQAIVIGKKPGTWSFPSGHSATAFAGAWLLNSYTGRGWKLRYLLAASVAFSRVYLGDHYPGDVVSGSLLGLVFARVFRTLFGRRITKNTK